MTVKRKFDLDASDDYPQVSLLLYVVLLLL